MYKINQSQNRVWIYLKKTFNKDKDKNANILIAPQIVP
jgi:hypothetical protein